MLSKQEYKCAGVIHAEFQTSQMGARLKEMKTLILVIGGNPTTLKKQDLFKVNVCLFRGTGENWTH